MIVLAVRTGERLVVLAVPTGERLVVQVAEQRVPWVAHFVECFRVQGC